MIRQIDLSAVDPTERSLAFSAISIPSPGSRACGGLHHYYDIPSRTKDQYVSGKGDPSNILAYLQFGPNATSRMIVACCSMTVLPFCRFYGYDNSVSKQERGDRH